MVHSFTSFASVATAALALSTLVDRVAAHSWGERIRNIASNGTLLEPPGFIRGYIGRSDPGFNDEKLTYRLTPATFNKDSPACMQSQQGRQSYINPSYPMLQTMPGNMVAFQYLENGHVTLPMTEAGRPVGSGVVYVYGTQDPPAVEKYLDVIAWTADGKGGNGKGKLLGQANYDDGQCYQVRNTPISMERQQKYPFEPTQDFGASDLVCRTTFQVPTDAQSGKPYTIYWVWNWSFTSGVMEVYTSCADLQVEGSAHQVASSKSKDAHDFATIDKSNRQVMAIPGAVEMLDKGDHNLVSTGTPNPNSGLPTGMAPPPPQPMATTTPSTMTPTTAPTGSMAPIVTMTSMSAKLSVIPTISATSMPPQQTASSQPLPAPPLAGGTGMPGGVAAHVTVVPVSTIMATITEGPPTSMPTQMPSGASIVGPTTCSGQCTMVTVTKTMPDATVYVTAGAPMSSSMSSQTADIGFVGFNPTVSMATSMATSTKPSISTSARTTSFKGTATPSPAPAGKPLTGSKACGNGQNPSKLFRTSRVVRRAL